MKNLHLLLVLAILSFSGCHVPSKSVQPVDFTILQMNDVYEIAPLEGGNAGGLARVAEIRRRLLAETPNVITVIAGDFLSPSLTANLNLENGEKIAGLQMIETLNALKVDYATFGNHEFDNRDSALTAKRINQCQFKFVSANVRRVYADGVIKPFTQTINNQPVAIPDYAIQEFSNLNGDKVKVALTGVLLPLNKRNYVNYLPIESAFKDAVARAKTESDVVIALTHQFAADDRALAKAVPGVPLFIGGHDHNHQDHYVENTIITKADANAKTVYIHRCRFDPVSKLIRIQSSLQYIDASIPSEPTTKAVVDRWVAKTDATLKANGYDPSAKISDLKETLECKESDVRSRPTNFGKLTNEAIEYSFPGADAYLINSGSMRLDDNLSGAVTQYDILRTFPFGGGFALQELPGSVLKTVLDAGLEKNRGEGGYLQSNHISKENGAWMVRGKAIDDQKNYKVVFSSFVASGSEANLGFLSKYKPSEPKTLTTPKGATIKNDVRDIVIAYLTK
jgi:5'-nucleotidase